MAWSIAEVARMSGVSSRTLRHYDEIGLLRPAHTGSNGHRYYGRAELLRLQQILLLRELDLGLADIRAVLDSRLDAVQALRTHHRRLLRERDRLTVLARTVARTIDELSSAEASTVGESTFDTTSITGSPGEERTAMTDIDRPENLFEGFDPAGYEEEARRRWPREWEQSQGFASTLTEADTERLQRETTAAMIRMAELMAAGAGVDSAPVQAEVDAAYRGVCRFWTPDADAFAALGRMYVEDHRFKANYDRVAEGLAEFYRDAMAHYAATVLG